MRHRVKAKHFNRDSNARKALFKSLLANLFEHGAIETTEEKAKQVKRLADKLIHRALPRTLHARRILERFFGSKRVVNQLVDGIAPNMTDRVTGFTRITRLGSRRGDDSTMVKIELVAPIADKAVVAKSEPVKEEKTEAKAAKPAAKKAAKPAAKKAENQEK